MELAADLASADGAARWLFVWRAGSAVVRKGCVDWRLGARVKAALDVSCGEAGVASADGVARVELAREGLAASAEGGRAEVRSSGAVSLLAGRADSVPVACVCASSVLCVLGLGAALAAAAGLGVMLIGMV